MSDKLRNACVVAVSAIAVAAGAADHDMHAQRATGDPRLFARIPDELRIHALANMRDHLAALQEIQDALAAGDFARAGDVAEERLGMDSLKRHGAHEVARFMPEGMRAIGSAMHRSASRFALAAHEAAASGDAGPALAALARVTQQCVACHATYRML